MPNNFGVPQITDENTRGALNAALESATTFGFPSMQRAFERVSKVLMVNNIPLDRIDNLADEEGLEIQIAKQGIEDTNLSIYFEWQREDNGLFSVFANVVTDNELEDLLNNSDHLDSLPDWEGPSEPYSETQKKWANKQLSEDTPIEEKQDYHGVAFTNSPENFATADDLTNAAVSMNNKSTEEKHPGLKGMYSKIAKNLIDKGMTTKLEESAPEDKYSKLIANIKTVKPLNENKGSVWKSRNQDKN